MNEEKEIKFNKYEVRGSDYHYKAIRKSNLLTYSAYVSARFNVHVGIVYDYFRAKQFDQSKTIHILDVGCGDGVLIYLLNQKLSQFNVKLYGVDNAAPALEIARQQIPNAEFKEGSAYSLDYPDNYFDIVVSSDVIEHVQKPDEMLTEIYRVSKADAFVSIGTPIRIREQPFDPMHVQEFFVDQFKDMVSKDFADVDIIQSHDLLYYILQLRVFNILGKKPQLFKYIFGFIDVVFRYNFFERKKKDNDLKLYSYMVATGIKK